VPKEHSPPREEQVEDAAWVVDLTPQEPAQVIDSAQAADRAPAVEQAEEPRPLDNPILEVVPAPEEELLAKPQDNIEEKEIKQDEPALQEEQPKKEDQP